MSYFATFPRTPARPVAPSPDAFLAAVFSSAEATTGGVVRPRIGEVERIAGRGPFLAYCRAHGFRVLENNGHFVVLCNGAPVVLHD